MRASNRMRAGFTIVELMVATALCLFIMVILTGAFQAGIDTFRQMKAIGNMQEKLRSATTIIKRDLAAQHFDGIFRPGTQGPYLSDQRLDLVDWTPPDQGFFRIWQGPIPNVGVTIIEGADADGIQSTRAFTHLLHFTAKLQGNRFNELFAAATGQPLASPPYSPPDFLDGQSFYSPWAEVAYFLVSNGQFANGQPLFTLYRRQRLLLPEALKTTNPGALANANPVFVDVSQYNGANGNFYNTPSDSTVPQRRLQPIVADGNGFSRYQTIGEALPGGPATGDDILMTDVISFEVRATGNRPLAVAAGPIWPRTLALGNTDYPFDDLPATGQNSQFNQMGVRVFDTWSKATDPAVPIDYSTAWATPGTPNSLPLKIRVRALQIKLRIWDNKIQQARQVTIIQDV